MLFDWNTIAAPAALLDVQLSAPRTLTGEGLWVCLVSSGQMHRLPARGVVPHPPGAVLVLPPQSAAAGHLILSRAPLALTPEDNCHLLCVQLTGQASYAVSGRPAGAALSLPKASTCPAAAELMGRLAEEKPTHSRARSQLVYALLCELADADSAAPALPPLVQAAIEDIRANYAGPVRRGGAQRAAGRLQEPSCAHLYRRRWRAAGQIPDHRARRSSAAAAAAPGVHAGRGGQPVRLFRGQLPVPGIQKRNRPVPCTMAGTDRSRRTEPGLHPRRPCGNRRCIFKAFPSALLLRSSKNRVSSCGEQFRSRECRPYARHPKQPR